MTSCDLGTTLITSLVRYSSLSEPRSDLDEEHVTQQIVYFAQITEGFDLFRAPLNFGHPFSWWLLRVFAMRRFRCGRVRFVTRGTTTLAFEGTLY